MPSLAASVACPDDNRLLGYVEGGVAWTDRTAIASHLATCPECAEVVALAGGDAEAARSPEPGDRLGRYRLLARLGAGAMGTVFEAEDLALGRRVAVKVLRSGGPATQDRFAREAQCLATVCHPAVVGIHDVGHDGEHAFFAMELVEGCSLRDLLAVRRPADERIVALFVRAGQGLAAAHEAGLVHRDFKPGNVLVTPSGAVKVVDFGLAKHVPEPEPTLHSGAKADVGHETTAGLGTPAFMAPERRAGRPGDARSDQYSFCAALGHALTGKLPDDPGADEARRALPRRWRRVLTRGLDLDPAERYPSMQALLEVLAPARSRPRSVFLVAAAGVLLTAGLLLGGGLASANDRCADSAVDAIWNDDVRATVDERVAAVVDGHARTWRSLDEARCRAETVGRAPDEAVSRCLDAQLSDLAAYLDVARSPERASWSAVADAWLGSAVRCEAPAAPQAPRPGDRHERAHALRHTLQAHATLRPTDVWMLVGDPAGYNRLDRRQLPSLELVHSCRLPYDGTLWELGRHGDRLWSIDRERDLRVELDPETCSVVSATPVPGDVYKNGRGFDVLSDGSALVVLDGTELSRLGRDGQDAPRVLSFGSLAPESLAVCPDGMTYVTGHHGRAVGRTLFGLSPDRFEPRRIGPIGTPVDIDTLACGPGRLLLGADTRGDVRTLVHLIDPQTARRVELGSISGGINGLAFCAGPSSLAGSSRAGARSR